MTSLLKLRTFPNISEHSLGPTTNHYLPPVSCQLSTTTHHDHPLPTNRQQLCFERPCLIQSQTDNACIATSSRHKHQHVSVIDGSGKPEENGSSRTVRECNRGALGCESDAPTGGVEQVERRRRSDGRVHLLAAAPATVCTGG
jgi:hypothetical protein